MEHTCELIAELANAGISEGLALAAVEALEEALEAAREELEAAQRNTYAAMQAVSVYAPCNEGLLQ